MTQIPDEADQSAVPNWVARMRADGYTVRIGTDPTPLPIEPEIHFGPPYEVDNGLRERPTTIVQKLWNARRFFKRRTAHP